MFNRIVLAYERQCYAEYTATIGSALAKVTTGQ